MAAGAFGRAKNYGLFDQTNLRSAVSRSYQEQSFQVFL